jgi:uncharacterized protein
MHFATPVVERLVAILIRVLAIAVCFPAGLSLAASFNCSQTALTTVELTICGDEALSQVDSDVASFYKKAREINNHVKLTYEVNLPASQREWLSERNRCGSDRDCLLKQYTSRKNELLEIIDQHTPDRYIPDCPESGELTPHCVGELITVLVGGASLDARLSASFRLHHWLTDNGVETCQDSKVVERRLTDVLRSLDDSDRDIAANTLDLLGYGWTGATPIACCMSGPHKAAVIAALRDFRTRHSDYGFTVRVDQAIDKDLSCSLPQAN